MRWAGHDIIRDRVARYGIDCDLKAGYLDVALKKRHLKAFRAEFDTLQRHEFPHEFKLLSASETRDVIGTEAYIGSLLNMGNGHLHPLNLCVGEARAAVKNGATIYESSPALRIEMQGKPKVITQNGSVLADWVVIAGNAYHSLVPELRGILFPVNSFIIATEPLSNELAETINPTDLAVCDPNFVLEYFRLSADKRLLFGGRINYFGADPSFIKKNLRPRMLKIYPQLQGHEDRLCLGWHHWCAVQSGSAVRKGCPQRYLRAGVFRPRRQRDAPCRTRFSPMSLPEPASVSMCSRRSSRSGCRVHIDCKSRWWRSVYSIISCGIGCRKVASSVKDRLIDAGEPVQAHGSSV